MNLSRFVHPCKIDIGITSPDGSFSGSSWDLRSVACVRLNLGPGVQVDGCPVARERFLLGECSRVTTMDSLRMWRPVTTSWRRPRGQRALIAIAEPMRRDCGVTPEETGPRGPARRTRFATTHPRGSTRGVPREGPMGHRVHAGRRATETATEWAGSVVPLRIGTGRRVGSERIVMERPRRCRNDCGNPFDQGTSSVS